MGNGKIYVIGLGPGGREQMTTRALRALEECNCVAGYGLYLNLIEGLIAGKERIETGMTRELERCRAALDAALGGKTVALVSSGDAGVYGMAGPLLEVCAGSFVQSGYQQRPPPQARERPLSHFMAGGREEGSRGYSTSSKPSGVPPCRTPRSLV